MPKSKTVLYTLGKGTFSLCREGSLYVAKEIKIVDEMRIKLAINEVKHLKMIKSEHVIEYYGCVTENDIFYVDMEYMSEGSLRKILQTIGPLPESAAIKYIRQILDGLSYIHSKGIVHGNLKCKNLLLNDQRVLKLGDFGLAIQLYSTVAQSPSFVKGLMGDGKRYWMAPEICQGESFSLSADLWSLGCTIVEIFTTVPPYFRKYSNEDTFVAALKGDTLSYNPNEIAPDASVPMKMFLIGLLNMDKTKRLSTGEDAKAKFKMVFPE